MIGKKSFDWLYKLQVKIFIICFIIAISIIFLFMCTLYGNAVKKIEENAYNHIYESMRYAENHLDIMIDDAIKISLVIAINNKSMSASTKILPREGSYQWFKEKKEINSFLSNLAAYKNHIKMTAIIGNDGRTYQSGGEFIPKSYIEEEWFLKTKESTSVQIFYNTPRDKRIFLCRQIRQNKKAIGTAIVELNYNIISQAYNITPLEKAQIIAFDLDGNIIFTNNGIDDNVGNIKETSLVNYVKEYQVGRRYYKIDGEKKLMVLYKSNINKLTTIGMISYNDLITDALQFKKNMLRITICSIIIVSFASWFFSSIVCRNIQKLNRSMYEVEQGNLKIRSDITGRDEIAVMAHGFNSMMDRIEQLLQEILEKEQQKRKAEIQALQMQVHPHFIYNVLNSIKYVAHMKNENEIEEVSTALIELLRGILGKSNNGFITIREEYRYIEQYMKIQRFKYGRQFSLEWDVEENLWEFPIPELLLQPIIENALIHGIACCQDGHIYVKIYCLGGNVIFKIIDDGEGMTEREIQQLMSARRKETDRFCGIGLRNIIDRIHFIYGNEYDVKVTSIKGMFTCVKMILPYERGDEKGCQSKLL